MEKTNQSYEELVRGAEVEKEAGNQFFKDEEYHAAIERYQEAIQVVLGRRICESFCVLNKREIVCSFCV